MRRLILALIVLALLPASAAATRRLGFARARLAVAHIERGRPHIVQRCWRRSRHYISCAVSEPSGGDWTWDFVIDVQRRPREVVASSYAFPERFVEPV